MQMRGVRHTGSRGRGQTIRTYDRGAPFALSPRSNVKKSIVLSQYVALWCYRHLEMSVDAVTKMWVDRTERRSRGELSSSTRHAQSRGLGRGAPYAPHSRIPPPVIHQIAHAFFIIDSTDFRIRFRVVTLPMNVPTHTSHLKV